MSAQIIPLFAPEPCAVVISFPKSAIFRSPSKRTQPQPTRSAYQAQLVKTTEAVNDRRAARGLPPITVARMEEILKGRP